MGQGENGTRILQKRESVPLPRQSSNNEGSALVGFNYRMK